MEIYKKKIYYDALQKRNIEQIKKSEEIKKRNFRSQEQEQRFKRNKDLLFLKKYKQTIEGKYYGI